VELAMQNIIRTILVVLVCLVCLSTSVQAQTEFKVLPGDIAVIGYRTDNHNFAIVCLKEIPIGTKIRFTDNGWLVNDTFRTGEGILYWTTTSLCELGMIKTIVPLTLDPNTDFKLSTSGDQIFIYQELTSNKPNFIFGLNTYDNIWQLTAESPTTSRLPTELSNENPVPAIAIKNRYYSIYTGEREFDTTDQALISITNPGNWTASTTPLNLPSGLFSFKTTAVEVSEFSAETGGENAPWFVILGLVVIPVLVMLWKKPKRNCCQ
jgi:hypothetical protein